MNGAGKGSDELCCCEVSVTPESDAFGTGGQEGWEGVLLGRGSFH